MNAKKITILGSTGSIGVQTLEIVTAFPGRFEIVGLSAGRNLTRLKEQILAFRPSVVCVRTASDSVDLGHFIKVEVTW